MPSLLLSANAMVPREAHPRGHSMTTHPEWCANVTRFPTGRPEPCSLVLGHPGTHTYVGPGDCIGWHSPFTLCIRCDDGKAWCGCGDELITDEEVKDGRCVTCALTDEWPA